MLTITWLGSASTTSTYTVNKNAYYGTRYYHCRVYAKQGTNQTSTVTSAAANAAEMTLKRVKITIDGNNNNLRCRTNGGTYTFVDDATYYVEYNNAKLYTATTGTNYGDCKAGNTMLGEYCQVVMNSSGSIIANVTNWTNSSSQWAITTTSDKSLIVSPQDSCVPLYGEGGGSTNTKSNVTKGNKSAVKGKGTYTVNYNCSENEGTGNTTASVTSNSAVDLTKKCTKEGWTFVGWNTDSKATTGLKSYTMPSDDITLYGIYSKEITSTFNSNGTGLTMTHSEAGSSTTSLNVSCTAYNKETTCTLHTPSIEGKPYYFSSDKDETGKWNEPSNKGTMLYSNKDEESSGGTYYIVAKPITVTFKPNSATIGGSSSDITKKCYYAPGQDESCTILSPTITRSGYTAIGYNTSSTGTSSMWNSNETKTITQNEATYYAITKKNETTSYSVKLYPNEGTWTGISGNPYTLTFTNIGYFPGITRTNYTLAGWYRDSIGSSTIYTNYVTSNDNNHNFYAKWLSNGGYKGSCYCVTNSDCESSGYDTYCDGQCHWRTTGSTNAWNACS